MGFRRIRHGLGVVSLFVVAGLVLAGCGESGQSADGQGGKLQVVASTNVWGSVLSAVGGDRVSVTSIISDPSADPHSYESTPADAIAVQNAKLALYNGGGYDDYFTKLADQAPDVSKLVAFDISGKGKNGDKGANEHVWYDLPTVGAVADQVAVRLSQIDPADKQIFADNASVFKSKAAQLLDRVRQLGAAHQGQKVVATEPVAHYLLDAAGVTDATPKDFSEAVEQEADVPVAAVEQITQLIVGKQVKALVDNEQTTTPITEQVVDAAKKAGIPVVGVTETLPKGATDYIAWMTTEVDALAGALNS
jgi:zinc/manganese transport system substrate-binding protein